MINNCVFRSIELFIKGSRIEEISFQVSPLIVSRMSRVWVESVSLLYPLTALSRGTTQPDDDVPDTHDRFYSCVDAGSGILCVKKKRIFIESRRRLMFYIFKLIYQMWCLLTLSIILDKNFSEANRSILFQTNTMKLSTIFPVKTRRESYSTNPQWN